MVTTAISTEMNVGTLFWAAAFSPLWVVVMKLHGLYDNDRRRIRHSTFDELPHLLSAVAIGTVLLDALLAISPVGGLPTATALLIGVLALAFDTSGRASVRTFWKATTGLAVGLVVGSPEDAALLARRLRTHPETRIDVIGYLGADNDPEAADGLPYMGATTELARIIDEAPVDRVILSNQTTGATEAEWMIAECKRAGIGLTMLPRNFTILGPGIELNRLAEVPVLDFRFADPSRSTLVLKRIMDVVVAVIGLILAAPLLVIAAILIKLDSRGPILFKQDRAGKNGKTFRVLKLRTMCTDAEDRLGEFVDLYDLEQPAFKIRNDPRVTRVGRVLRRSSLDEIPQMFNVLRGDMSLVGPRPEEVAVVALYNEHQRARLLVRPGLTGPMQISGRGSLTFEERLALDRDYLDNVSIAGDVAILLRTPRAIVRGDGAY